MIYIGNNEISNIYIGTDKIYGIYVGDLQIYPTDIILTAISLENLVWVTNIPASGGTATKDNCTYSVTAYYSDGTTVDVTSEATITGSQVIPSTNIEEVHSAGTLTLTASYSGFSATGNVTIYQEAAEKPDFSTEPLTFNILSAGTIIWRASSTSITKTIEYKLNDGGWTSVTSNTSSSAPKINVVEGDKIQFKGNNAQYATDYYSNYNSFSGSTASFEIEGNIMSLIYGDDFKNNLTISSNYAFTSLFRGCTNLVSAENLILPATSLTNYCYDSMFYNCRSLTTAPALSATSLARNCYSSMFWNCSSLTSAPELPATTLANSCYIQMFYNCRSLTTAPALPATTLAGECYSSMFSNCTSLSTAPELPATTLADSCYNSMFNGTNVLPDCSNIDFASSTVVASGGLKGLFSGTKVTDNDLERLLPKNDNGRYYLPVTTLASFCYSNMFQGCKSLTTAPELPATTLKTYCYQNMFQGCTSLTAAPALPATTLANFCYNNMFEGCKSLTTAPELPATTLANYCYSNMFQNCTSLTTAPALPATTLAPNCYQNMFMSCASLTTAPELPSTTLADSCYLYMFYNCSKLTTAPSVLPATTLANSCYQTMFASCASLTSAPTLPATTLAQSCYQNMFLNCTNLNYIKCLATDISAPNCTNSWVKNVASTGTFVKASSITSWTTGVNGIPANWIVEDNQEPLTFNILSAGTINWKASETNIEKTIEYKLNNGAWVSITSNAGSSAPTITVNSGDKIQFRGNNAQYSTSPSSFNSFGGSASFEVEGNIMSLIYGDDFKNKLSISSTNTFYGLFRDCTNLVSAENLILPATTLADSCYERMFQGCTSLTTAPELPATTLASFCYSSMFDGCTSLTTAPALPATTLAYGCYDSMFGNCTSLSTAPSILPAITLAENCYASMFYGCSSLETAPELPANTLVDGCYSTMFADCSSLNYIKCLATDISAYGCTDVWVYGVAPTGTFVKNSVMNDWTEDEQGIPSGWTVIDA